MKIYTNKQYNIVSIDQPPASYEYCFEVEQTRTEMFGDWCDACIQGYKYEPQYEFIFNEDGSNVRNEKTGDLLYKLDAAGNKKLIGYACYSFIDYKTLRLIQKQYEDSQKQVQELSAKIEYLSMMTGFEVEVNNE